MPKGEWTPTELATALRHLKRLVPQVYFVDDGIVDAHEHLDAAAAMLEARGAECLHPPFIPSSGPTGDRWDPR